MIKHASRETSRVLEIKAIAVDLVFQRVTRKNAKRAVNPRGVRRDKRLTVLGRRVIDVRTEVDERRPGRLIGVTQRIGSGTDIVVESGAFRARAVVGELIVLRQRAERNLLTFSEG
jgi:hypothetical protein